MFYLGAAQLTVEHLLLSNRERYHRRILNLQWWYVGFYRTSKTLISESLDVYIKVFRMIWLTKKNHKTLPNLIVTCLMCTQHLCKRKLVNFNSNYIWVTNYMHFFPHTLPLVVIINHQLTQETIQVSNPFFKILLWWTTQQGFPTRAFPEGSRYIKTQNLISCLFQLAEQQYPFSPIQSDERTSVRENNSRLAVSWIYTYTRK